MSYAAMANNVVVQHIAILGYVDKISSSIFAKWYGALVWLGYIQFIWHSTMGWMSFKAL